MSLTKHMIDMGKPVAYFPNMKIVAGSTNANLLLCQLIYWCDKTKDNGWIWKNSHELEKETGLSYNEQRTARKTLIKNNLIEEVEEKLKHRMKFRVNEDRVNELWEQRRNLPFEEFEEVEEAPKLELKKAVKPVPPISKPVEVVKPPELAKPEPTGEMGAKARKMTEIKDMLRKKFHINPFGYKWDVFCEYVYTRETQYNEKLEVFVKWGLANGYDPRFWTAEKMTTLYPQAFITKEEETDEEDGFIDLMPQIPKDEKSVPMPKDMRISHDW